MKWKSWFDEGWKGGMNIVIFVKREIASNIRIAKVMIEDKGDIGFPNKREGEKRGRRRRTKVLYLCSIRDWRDGSIRVHLRSADQD